MYRLFAVDDWASLAVRLVLEDLGQPYQVEKLQKDAGDLDAPAFRARSPFGKIPALDTPDGPMFETGAILSWLSERHGALAPRAGDADRAAFLSWFVFVNTTIHTHVLTLIHPHRPAGEGEAEVRVRAGARARIEADLAVIDAMIARDRPWWLSGDRPSILSWYLGMLVRWMRLGPPGAADDIPLDPFPALRAVMAQLEQHPAALRAALAEGAGPTIFTDPAYHRS